MKNIACLIAAVVLLPATAIANDRTEDGTVASRNLAERNGSFGDTRATNSEGFGTPYVNPAGADPSESSFIRYGAGSTETIEFLTIKRQGIELDTGNDD